MRGVPESSHCHSPPQISYMQAGLNITQYAAGNVICIPDIDL